MSPPEVLIVDDEPGLLKLFCSLVQRLDCTIIRAPGGAEALAILEQHTPDVLILDIAMPEVSGIDVLKVVSQTPRLDNMQIMVLTAVGSSHGYEGVAARVSQWVKKPIMPMDFLRMVQDMLPDDHRSGGG